MPIIFAFPGARVDPRHSTLAHALYHGVIRWTGLKVKAVRKELVPSEELEIRPLNGDGEGYTTKTCLGMNFWVEIEEEFGAILPGNSEDPLVVWVYKEALEGMQLQDGMRGLIRRAFAQFGEGGVAQM